MAVILTIILLQVTGEPTITDWIQATGVLLGVPITIWGIFKLFLKDKQRELEVKALKDMALAQEGIVLKLSQEIEEITKQTQEFRYQSVLLNDSNELLREQIKIQTDAHISNADHKNEMLKLENKKRLSDIKPFIIFNGANSSGHEFFIRLKNIGKRASLIEIDNKEPERVAFKSIPTKTLNENQTTEISGKMIGEAAKLSTGTITFEAYLIIEDEDNNRYNQRIKGTGSQLGQPKLEK